MGKWRVRRVVCERCGQEVSEARLPMHRRSLFHRRYRQIKRLLEANRLSFTEIAASIGVTREWVRQVAGRMGYTGTALRRERTLRGLLKAANLERLLEQMRAPGLNVSPLVITGKGGVGRVLKKHLLINGWVCAVRKALTPKPRMLGLKYEGLRPVDFVLFRAPQYWLVIPREEVPRGTMLLAPHLAPLYPGIRRSRRDWKQYVNAWHLLKKA